MGDEILFSIEGCSIQWAVKEGSQSKFKCLKAKIEI
jgi:hypothetical protein